jgi:hypothetical protein
MSFHKNGAILLRLLDGLLFRRPVTRLGPRHDLLVSRRLSKVPAVPFVTKLYKAGSLLRVDEVQKTGSE